MSRQKAAKPSKVLADVSAARRACGLNQQDFWAPYGTSQSGGSRYESERDMPVSVKLLLVLEEQGKITRADLEAAQAVVAASR